MVEYIDLDHSLVCEVVKSIRALPRSRSFDCRNCGDVIRHLTLEIYAKCPGCGTEYKTRSFGANSEPQDIIALVLEWLGDGPEAEEIFSRRHEFALEAEEYTDEGENQSPN